MNFIIFLKLDNPLPIFYSTNESNQLSNPNNTEFVLEEIDETCKRENTLLFLILMLGTVWLSIRIFKFNSSSFLNYKMRELVSDYALPISVIFFSFVGSYFFRQVQGKSN